MGRRVALLARPGVACDRLRVALADAGAQVVLEADPLTLDPAALDAAGAQVVMVALDAQTEEVLERFDVALQDPAIEVIFEEAELAAKREGWEAARWARHLAAKLHRHDDVLPPGAESATAPATQSGHDSLPAFEPVAEATSDFIFEADLPPSFAPPTDGAPNPFDPLLAEFSFDEPALPRDDGEDPLATDRELAASASFDTDLDFSFDGSFDPVAAMEPDTASAPAGFDAFDFHQAAALVDGQDEPGVETRIASPERSFNQMFDGDFAAAAVSDAAQDTPPNFDRDDAAPGNLPLVAIKPLLELVGTDDDIPPALRGYAEPTGEGPAANTRFKHDLASLESRIAGMELVDDRITKGEAQAEGAVLVMAGIGGPDAVRQLLGALPTDFPRAVLVQQRLDGGRYDKLVAQMQRATAMLVKLAEPGLPAIGGVIYILPAAVGLQLGDAGLRFTDTGGDVLAMLPSADSAVLLLSGSDPAQIDAVMNHSWAGALVMGQAPEGCYDSAATSALVARGGDALQPPELARRLAERWHS